jgi:hypothetical protein
LPYRIESAWRSCLMGGRRYRLLSCPVDTVCLVEYRVVFASAPCRFIMIGYSFPSPAAMDAVASGGVCRNQGIAVPAPVVPADPPYPSTLVCGMSPVVFWPQEASVTTSHAMVAVSLFIIRGCMCT